MTETLPETGDDLFAGQPVRVVERDGVRYTLLGTAHVSRARRGRGKAIDSGRFDAVAVELDPQRLQALSDPDTPKLDLVEVIRKAASPCSPPTWPCPPTSAAWPNNSTSSRARN